MTHFEDGIFVGTFISFIYFFQGLVQAFWKIAWELMRIANILDHKK